MCSRCGIWLLQLLFYHCLCGLGERKPFQLEVANVAGSWVGCGDVQFIQPKKIYTGMGYINQNAHKLLCIIKYGRSIKGRIKMVCFSLYLFFSLLFVSFFVTLFTKPFNSAHKCWAKKLKHIYNNSKKCFNCKGEKAEKEDSFLCWFYQCDLHCLFGNSDQKTRKLCMDYWSVLWCDNKSI